MKTTTKALSIKQPWAWAICNLPDEFKKDIENRTWDTKHHGRFLVHTGKTFDKEGYVRLKANLDNLGYKGHIPEPKEFTMGAIIGVSELSNVAKNGSAYHAKTESIWYEGDFGFVLEGSKAFKNPIPYKGKLGFFDIDGDVVRSELEYVLIHSNPFPLRDNYSLSVGDAVCCRMDAFDVITQFSKNSTGWKFFKGSHIIKEIKDEKCRFDDLGIGYSWYHKDDLIPRSMI